ncbi:MAG: hypothetical protein Q9159_005108 [Coniocarpon cinnabarinum]
MSTFFSLGHSTIVIITSIVVAATAASVSDKFEGFSTIGGIIGSAVSAAFLLILGLANAYILYLLFRQLRHTIAEYRLLEHSERGRDTPQFRIEGGGIFFRIFRKLFVLIDRPWKMYPLGVLFGLGFDTSSQIALLGISAVQSVSGRSFWLILIFPVLFTAGMCLLDTTDGALMLSLYTAGAQRPEKDRECSAPPNIRDMHATTSDAARADIVRAEESQTTRVRGDESVAEQHRQTEAHQARRPDALTLLYYNTILTVLTVIVAVIIGVIQILGLADSICEPEGQFWDGVRAVQDKYDILGGAICGAFVVVGLTSVLLHKRWRKWVLRDTVNSSIHLADAEA